MPIEKSDVLVMYPFKVEFQINVFAPGEFVPHQPREYSFRPDPDPTVDEVVLSEEEKEALLQPRGETQKVKSVTAIYYDAAQDPEAPEWVELDADDIKESIVNKISEE